MNIGLILHAPEGQHLAFDWDLRRISSKITRPDKEIFKHYEEQLEAIENDEVGWQQARFETIRVQDHTFLEQLSDYVGDKIVFDTPRGCLTDNPDRTFDELFNRFVLVRAARVARITKRTLVKQVKEAFEQRAIAEYLKPKPAVVGTHREYTLPLGILHSRKTFIEVLNLGPMAEKNYKTMAAVGRLWQDAVRVPTNRNATLYALVHYSNGAQVQEGEQLMREDGVHIVHQPAGTLRGIDVQHVREWA